MLNTIQDIERYNVTNRLERNGTVGSNVIHLRSTPHQLVGATLTFEPGTVRQESHVVTAVSEHQVTLATSLAYLHELDTPAVRLDLINLAQNGEYSLSSNASAGAVSLVVNYVPDWVKIGTYIIVDPYTIECEIRKITNITGTTLTVAALTYTHAAGDPVIFEHTDIVNAKWFGAKGDGTTNDLLALQRALSAAGSTDSRKLYIPGGTYLINITQLTALDYGTPENIHVYGDGFENTLIKLDAVILTWALIIFRLRGDHQKLSDIGITAAAGLVRGDYSIGVVTAGEYAGTTARHAHVERVKIFDIRGTVNTNHFGYAFGDYESWNTLNANTTLAAEVSATGSQTFTPVSMENIYHGRYLIFDTGGANEEGVIVTDINSATTAVATFTKTHALGETVKGYSQRNQYTVFEDCIAQNLLYMTGFGSASGGGSFIRCKAIGGAGMSPHAHGFYAVGSNNYLENCYVEGWNGYSYHFYKQTPNADASGDRMVGCVSINPDWAHVFIGGLTNTSNPEYKVSENMLRYTQIVGCLFRQTNGYVTQSGLLINEPAIVESCVFEDNYNSTGGGIVDIGGAQSIVKGNKVVFTNNATGSVNMYGFATDKNGVIISDNICESYGPRLKAGSTNCIVRGNVVIEGQIRIDSGSGHIVEGNNITFGNATYEPLVWTAGTEVTIRNNRINNPSGNSFENNLSGLSGIVQDNDFIGDFKISDAANVNITFINNKMDMKIGTGAKVAQQRGSGVLSVFTANGNINEGRLVKLSSGVAELLTSDVSFVGVAPMYVANGVAGYFILQPGSICYVYCDGAWTAGNICVPSSSAAGKCADAGSTIPSPGSYGVFLDTGGGAGLAKVLIVKTI